MPPTIASLFGLICLCKLKSLSAAGTADGFLAAVRDLHEQTNECVACEPNMVWSTRSTFFNCFQRRATLIAVVVRGVHSSNVSAALEELADGRNNDNYDITMRLDHDGNRHYHKFTSNLNAAFLNLKPSGLNSCKAWMHRKTFSIMPCH